MKGDRYRSSAFSSFSEESEPTQTVTLRDGARPPLTGIIAAQGPSWRPLINAVLCRVSPFEQLELDRTTVGEE